jgi:thiamine-phosphate pyrophosphorylase
MIAPFPDSGLYAITDSSRWSGSKLVRAVGRCLDGGARVLQFREKTREPDIALVRELLKLCRLHRVPFIINDDIDLALRVNADGVHLGRRDSDVVQARQQLGAGAIVGISCYDLLERAHQAERDGANYVAFGAFFPSSTKPGATPVDRDILKRVSLRVPVVAIGGITPDNGGKLLEAGANLLAVIRGIFGQDDPRKAAENYRQLFEPWNGRRKSHLP